jgi:hypothetical protein
MTSARQSAASYLSHFDLICRDCACANCEKRLDHLACLLEAYAAGEMQNTGTDHASTPETILGIVRATCRTQGDGLDRLRGQGADGLLHEMRKLSPVTFSNRDGTDV